MNEIPKPSVPAPDIIRCAAMDLVVTDLAASRAFYVDGLGWVGFDVSNGISPDTRYVRVATGRDYREAAPVTGISYGARDQAMHVRLAVEQQHVEQ